MRTYRVARVLDCTVLDQTFKRPVDFDLADYWRAATRRLAVELHPNRATLRVSPLAVKLLEVLSDPYVRAETRISEEADAAGWRTATLPVGRSPQHVAVDLLRLGPEAEVLDPPELRETIAELIQAMAARYQL